MHRSQQEKSSAADTSVGFDYQFYYFFYLILGLRLGETIGFEVKDDIHIDFADGTTELIQTKHTVQTTASGQIINLTELSGDLWKTLSNWAKVLNEQSDKKTFIAKTCFKLVTNKANSENRFLQNLAKFNNGEISFTEIKDYLKNLFRDTTDGGLKVQINTVLSTKGALKDFLSKIQLDLNEDNLIERIKNRIVEKIHFTEKVEDVYNTLQSALRDKNYLDIKAGKKLVTSFAEFSTQFRNCFKVGLSSILPKRDLPILLPENKEDQLFIKQLIDIGDILPFDEEKIIELTTYMLKFINNYTYWEMNDGLLPSQKEEFQRNSRLIWKNSFERVYRKITMKFTGGVDLIDMEAEIKEAAIECLDDMKRQLLTIDETLLDAELSNGSFYFLTEQKSIGWHFNWKTRY
jgi:hypothetical protein